MQSMIGKAWSLLVFVVVAVILINVAIEAVKPFLPLVGLVVAILLIVAIFRLLISRRKPW